MASPCCRRRRTRSRPGSRAKGHLHLTVGFHTAKGHAMQSPNLAGTGTAFVARGSQWHRYGIRFKTPAKATSVVLRVGALGRERATFFIDSVSLRPHLVQGTSKSAPQDPAHDAANHQPFPPPRRRDDDRFGAGPHRHPLRPRPPHTGAPPRRSHRPLRPTPRRSPIRRRGRPSPFCGRSTSRHRRSSNRRSRTSRPATG